MELLVVALIVAVLATIALPAYTGSVRKARRADAKATLTQIAQRLERCFTQFGAYNDPNCVVPSPQESPERYYSVTTARTATSFALTAAPQGDQAADTKCTTLTLNHQGSKGATGSDSANCW